MHEDDERLKSPDSRDENVSETPGQTGQAEDHRIGTPPIGNDDQKLKQTQSPAADDDVGVPDEVGQDEDAS